MKKARLFKNGESQAVRLPKEFRFSGKEVFIIKKGKAVILLAKENFWDSFLSSLGNFSKDFMSEREQVSFEKRNKVF